MTAPHNKRRQAFGSLSREVKEVLDQLVPSHVYPATIELYRQGSHAKEVYFIYRGLVKLVRMEGDGHELIIDFRLPGWLLGAAAVITSQQHPVTATTLNECTLQRIPAELFHTLLATNQELSLHVHQMHSHEAIAHITHLAQLSCLSAQDRLGHLLAACSCARTEQCVRGSTFTIAPKTLGTRTVDRSHA